MFHSDFLCFNSHLCRKGSAFTSNKPYDPERYVISARFTPTLLRCVLFFISYTLSLPSICMSPQMASCGIMSWVTSPCLKQKLSASKCWWRSSLCCMVAIGYSALAEGETFKVYLWKINVMSPWRTLPFYKLTSTSVLNFFISDICHLYC